MKRVQLFVIVCLLFIKGYSQCADPVNIFQFEFDAKTYEVVKEELSWDDAAACSKERGGYLVEINSVVEQDAIFDKLLNEASISASYLEDFVWIGATDKAEEGTWIWDGNNDGEGEHFWSGQGVNGDGTGEKVGDNFVNWGGKNSGAFQEPDNSGGPGQNSACIGLTGWPEGTAHLGSPGEWNDYLGTLQLYYIIEYDSVSTSLPHDSSPVYISTEIKVFPNPSMGILHVTGEDILGMDIYSVTGRRTGSFYRSPLDISHYQKGVYFLRVRTQTSIHTIQFIRK